MSLFTLPLRVLIVAPRPDDLIQVPSQASIEACYEALEAQGEQVTPEWLWPATWEALRARLEDTVQPPVGVLYLDAVTARGPEGLGVRFEDAHSAASTWVTPHALGMALRAHGLGLVILALTGEEAESEGDRLASTVEVPVVALASALPSAVRAPVLSALFTAVLAGQPLAGAVSSARQVVRRRQVGRERFRGGETTPDVTEEEALRFYAVGADTPLVAGAPAGATGVGKIVRFPGPGMTPAWQRLAADPEAGSLPPEPPQGFIGRGRELKALERALRGEGLVLVHGYEGLGKTALAAHAARWLVRVGRFAQVVYTDFSGGGNAEMALYDLGVRLLGDDFTLHDGEALTRVEQALAQTPTLIVWDGLEALLPEGESPLDADSLSNVLQCGARWGQSGASRLCAMAETPTLPDPAYAAQNVALNLALTALDTEDAFTLLERLVEQGDAPAPPRAEAAELVNALGGHPLALSILVSLLDGRTMSDVMALLEEILPGLRLGEARLMNQALDLAVEALLRTTLDEETRDRLLPFGLFAGGFMDPMATSAAGLEEDAWARLKKTLTAAHVLREARLEGLTVPFMRLERALSTRLRRRIHAERLAVLEQTYSGSYMGLMRWMMQNQERAGAALMAVARCELPNLRRGFHLLLTAQQLKTAVDYVGLLQHFLEQLGLNQEREILMSQLQGAMAQALSEEGPLGRPGVQLLLSQGERLLSAGRVGEAAQLLQGLYARMTAENGLGYSGAEAMLDQSMALHRLGRCLQAAGQPPSALELYTRALGMLLELEAERAVQEELLALYGDIGGVLLSMLQWEQAQDAFQRGLAVAEALQDQRAQGDLSVHLANIAVAQQDWEQARQLYRTAMDHRVALQDVPGVALIWHQLGTVAWQTGALAEAEQNYQRALDLAQRVGHIPLIGQSWMQLAQVAQQAGRLADAEAQYARASEVYQQHDLAAGLVAAEMALGGLLLEQDRIAEAKTHAEAARTAVEALGPEAHPWEVYILLRRIAEAEADAEQIAHWRTRTQESFADSSLAEQTLQPWQPLIQGVARASRGESLDADAVALVENLEADAAWQHLAGTIWRILGGERGAELYAELDHVDALIVRRILEAIVAPPEEESTQAEG